MQSPSQCPKLAEETPTCANTYANDECWTLGEADPNCNDGDLCCFNGCENVCFPGKSSIIKVASTSEASHPPPPLTASYEVIQNSDSNSCPSVKARSNRYCQSSRPNCWSAGTYDLGKSQLQLMGFL